MKIYWIYQQRSQLEQSYLMKEQRGVTPLTHVAEKTENEEIFKFVNYPSALFQYRDMKSSTVAPRKPCFSMCFEILQQYLPTVQAEVFLTAYGHRITFFIIWKCRLDLSHEEPTRMSHFIVDSATLNMKDAIPTSSPLRRFHLYCTSTANNGTSLRRFTSELFAELISTNVFSST